MQSFTGNYQDSSYQEILVFHGHKIHELLFSSSTMLLEQKPCSEEKKYENANQKNTQSVDAFYYLISSLDLQITTCFYSRTRDSKGEIGEMSVK